MKLSFSPCTTAMVYKNRGATFYQERCGRILRLQYENIATNKHRISNMEIYSVNGDSEICFFNFTKKIFRNGSKNKMSTAHSTTFPSLHLHHNTFSNPSVALPTSQLILQPFYCFTYVTTHSPTLLSLLLRHRFFTYVTWRAAHGKW